MNLRYADQQQDYEECAKERTAIAARIHNSQDQVDQDSKELEDLREAVRAMSDKIEEHGANVTDAAPLKRMRSAHKALTAELNLLGIKMKMSSQQVWSLSKAYPHEQISDNQEEDFFD